jgi:intein/homing endonuclease
MTLNIHKYNHELKLIDTQEKAYLLGFFYGDGTIIDYKEKSGRQRYLTKISISITDQDLILKLKEYFQFFNIQTFDFSKYNLNSGKQISISKTSKELYFDLLSNGLYPRKSYENACKLRMPNIDDNLISHFIRGFFDADGSVYIPTRRPNLISIEFSSVAKEFIYEIDNYLKSVDINSWKIREKHPSKGRQTCYALTINKTPEILKLIDFMYTDANISLKRKADKCLNYKPIDKVKDRNILCPHCNSNHTWGAEIRGKSRRFRCQNCHKGFSVKLINLCNNLVETNV